MPSPLVLEKNAVCTAEDVKNIIDPSLNLQADPLLIFLINYFSKQVEEILGQPIQYGRYREFYHGGTYNITIAAPPIDMNEPIEVWEDPSRVFQDTTLRLTEGTDYVVVQDGSTGQIRRMQTVYAKRIFTLGYRNVQVIYTGGYTLIDPVNNSYHYDTALRGAGAMQVAYWYKNRDNLGLESLATPDGRATFAQPSKLLPGVRAVINSKQRLAGFLLNG